MGKKYLVDKRNPHRASLACKMLKKSAMYTMFLSTQTDLKNSTLKISEHKKPEQ